MGYKLKKVLSMALIMTVLSAVFILAPQQDAKAQIYRTGSRGAMVKTIQTKLRAFGHYRYAIDGIFGLRTANAVKIFQRTKGIRVDGIVGPITLKYLGITTSSGTVNSSTTYLLAKVIYGEARGEPYSGKVAIAAVILNRVKSPLFPNTIAGVVYQPGAFTVVSDGQINLTPDTEALRAARDAINGVDPTNGAIYYYNPKTATNAWIRSRRVVTTIGGHVFCL